MNVLLARARHWLRPTPPIPATATCAAGCGAPVVLTGMHYTVTRTTEREFARIIEPVDGDPLAYVHLDCWPARDVPVVITAAVDSPVGATVRAGGQR